MRKKKRDRRCKRSSSARYYASLKREKRARDSHLFYACLADARAGDEVLRAYRGALPFLVLVLA